MNSRTYFFLIVFFLYFLKGFSIENPANSYVYVDSIVPRIDIYLPADSFTKLMENPSSDHEYKATFVFQSTLKDSIIDIGFRLRGNTSRGSNKKSFKISFNTFVKGRKFYDVEKLNLNGEHNDPSIIRSKLVWDLFAKIGSSAARANHVQVYVNKEYFGLYINVEHIDENFTKSRFGNNNGNLYKCLSPANLKYIDSNPETYQKLRNGNIITYDLKSNDSTVDYSDLLNLIVRINLTPDSLFSEELEKVFDVDLYLKSIVVEILAGHWDNYIANANNYYLYHNESTGKFEYIPYDVDNTFGIDWFEIDWAKRNIYTWSFDSSPLYQRIMKVDKYKSIFTTYMKDFLENEFNTEKMFPEIDARKNLISYYAENDIYRTQDYGWTYDDFLKSYEESLGMHVKYGIKPYITERHKTALSQLLKTAIEEPLATNLEIFPNPFREQLTINFKEDIKNLHVEVYDIFGRKVFSKHLENTGQFIWNGCDNAGNRLKPNIYIIQLTSNNKLFRTKVTLK